ncbi:MAG: hypothetical protein ACC657_15960, partial [Thiohalomonadales bacterium]
VPHIDPNQGHTQVNPTTYSSMFIPLRFNLNHNKTLDDTNTLITNYKFNGSFYTNRNYSNADQQLHRFNIGNEKIFIRDKKQRNELYAGISLGYKKRLYVDRDTGDNQQSGPDDISDRYTYNFYGAELKYQNKKNNFKYRLQADLESRDYVKAGTVSEYDNNKIGLAGDISWRVIKPTKLYAGLEFYNIDYNTRPSRNENGDLFKSNPARKYSYSIFSVGVRHRFNHSWLVYLDLLNKQRDDKFKGYDNYTKILYKLRIHYRAMTRLKFKLSIVSWNRDYDNAFAFDHMEYGVKKTYDATIIKLAGIYQLKKDMTINISYLQNNQDSTDLRYVYDRAIALATFEWRF